MERDFTIKIYTELLETALQKGYTLSAYENFIRGEITNNKVYILRHDVDDLPYNSVKTAEIEKSLGGRGVYYFRIVKQSNVPDAIEKIAALGHEIGYHYEDLALCYGDYDRAYEQFLTNLAYFRKYYPVKTICMHGSPMSKWDNRKIWEKFDYKSFEIIAEPYFDTDFNKMLYITDTSRHWNGSSYSIRDKVEGLQANIASTRDLIDQLKTGSLSNQIMMNIHPQRWHNTIAGWGKELILQSTKNVIKKMISSNK
jgi:hypothetical protein